jgi:hypothetical protein
LLISGYFHVVAVAFMIVELSCYDSVVNMISTSLELLAEGFCGGDVLWADSGVETFLRRVACCGLVTMGLTKNNLDWCSVG